MPEETKQFKEILPLLNENQLKFPLDRYSQKIVKDLFIFPITQTLPGTSAATAANYGVFFTNNSISTWQIHSISESHITAGTDGSAVTLQIERLQGTEAPDNQDTLLSTPFNLKGTANTVQHGTTVVNKSLLTIQSGNRLCLKDSGTLTSVAGVNITVNLIKID